MTESARDRLLESYAASLRQRKSRLESDGPRPLLVGEDNPYGSHPSNALLCHPPGSAGERLQRLVLGVSQVEYLRDFDRVNQRLDDGRRKTGRDFTCPNGHPLAYSKPAPEVEKLRADLVRVTGERDAAIKECDVLRRRAEALQDELEVWRPASAVRGGEA